MSWQPGDFTKKVHALGYTSAHPLPSSEALADFYASVYYQDCASSTYQHEYSETELQHKRLRADLLLHSIEACSIKGERSRSLLEIGCGEGFVLNAAHSSGYAVTGVDFSDFGIKTFHKDLTRYVETGDAYEILSHKISQGQTVDACILQNVLEHVVDPRDLLLRMKSILGPSGLIAVTVPNDFSSLQSKAAELGLIDREYWFQPPQHLHYFNDSSIGSFAESCGLKLLDLYGDFPIEYFIFHPGSNYVADLSQGKAAHQARVNLDLLVSQRGIEQYHQYCRVMATSGVSRTITAVLGVQT